MCQKFARLISGRVHYAWIVLVVVFTAMFAGVGVRAAPGVMIVPLEYAFGWDVTTISGAVSINIILLGATSPTIFAQTNEVFGRRDSPVLVAWIFAGHQVGGALAATGAGPVRHVTGTYLPAFLASWLACFCASALVLHVSRGQLAVAPVR